MIFIIAGEPKIIGYFHPRKNEILCPFHAKKINRNLNLQPAFGADGLNYPTFNCCKRKKAKL